MKVKTFEQQWFKLFNQTSWDHGGKKICGSNNQTELAETMEVKTFEQQWFE